MESDWQLDFEDDFDDDEPIPPITVFTKRANMVMLPTPLSTIHEEPSWVYEAWEREGGEKAEKVSLSVSTVTCADDSFFNFSLIRTANLEELITTVIVKIIEHTFQFSGVVLIEYTHKDSSNNMFNITLSPNFDQSNSSYKSIAAFAKGKTTPQKYVEKNVFKFKIVEMTKSQSNLDNISSLSQDTVEETSPLTVHVSDIYYIPGERFVEGVTCRPLRFMVLALQYKTVGANEQELPEELYENGSVHNEERDRHYMNIREVGLVGGTPRVFSLQGCGNRNMSKAHHVGSMRDRVSPLYLTWRHFKSEMFKTDDVVITERTFYKKNRKRKLLALINSHLCCGKLSFQK